MTKVQFEFEERQIVNQLKQVAAEPDTMRPSVEFKRDWAYGNAGLENETITREQVKAAVKE